MNNNSLTKFSFKIKTRNGLLLDTLMVQARDRTEAEHKINQIYHYCEILECVEQARDAKPFTADIESVISLIGRTPA